MAMEEEELYAGEEIPGWGDESHWDVLTAGVPEVGTASCSVSLYEDQHGDRGVVAVADIVKHEAVLIIPLRLALTVYSDDDHALTYSDAPWSVRLACRLLREKAFGDQSPWYPYIQSLPKEIPCPLLSFSWEDFQSVEYEGIRQEMDEYVWMVSDAWQQLRGASHGDASREDFDWAMSIVHSRTFGTAGKKGPFDVRMLLPLADMLNHAGDRCKGRFSKESVGMESLDWAIISPERAKTGEWEMRLFATCDIAKDEQVLLSYGERNNDDFFLFYGFIPPLNPRDDYILFSHLEGALDWYRERFCINVTAAVFETKKAEAIERAKAEDLTRTPASEGLSGAERDQNAKIRVMSGGFVDGRLAVAFEYLQDLTSVTLTAAITDRCQELLCDKTDVLDDLSWLAKHISSDRHPFSDLHVFYDDAIAKHREVGEKLPVTSAPSMSTPSFTQYLIKTYTVYKKLILWDVLLGLHRPFPSESLDSETDR